MKTNTLDLIKVQYKYDGELVGAMDNIKYQYIDFGFISVKSTDHILWFSPGWWYCVIIQRNKNALALGTKVENDYIF